MSTPEPLDEFPDAPAETRGGDHFADITVQPELPFPDDDVPDEDTE